MERVKKIGLAQLAQKKYSLVDGLDPLMCNCIGIVEDAFDCIIYGESGNGKSNFTAMMVKALIKALNCRCEYVAYEEGSGLTIQQTFISRHNMLEELGNVLMITEHYTFDQLFFEMGKKQSAKIWVIDSIQAARFTEHQCAELKRKYVLGRKKKIIIYVSWADGKLPKGAAAKSVEYFANIKLRIHDLIVFPKTRYEKDGIGNKPFVIYEPGARARWGEDYEKVLYGKKVKTKKKKEKKAEPAKPEADQPKIIVQVMQEETKDEKNNRLVQELKFCK